MGSDFLNFVGVRDTFLNPDSLDCNAFISENCSRSKSKVNSNLTPPTSETNSAEWVKFKYWESYLECMF